MAGGGSGGSDPRGGGSVTGAAAYTRFHGRPKPVYSGTTPYTKHVAPGQRADVNCDHVINPGDQSRVSNGILTVTPPVPEYVTPCPSTPYPGTAVPVPRVDVNGDGSVNPGDQASVAAGITAGYGKFRDKTKQPFNEYSHWNTPLSLDAQFAAIDFWDFFNGHTGPASYDLDYFTTTSSSTHFSSVQAELLDAHEILVLPARSSRREITRDRGATWRRRKLSTPSPPISLPTFTCRMSRGQPASSTTRSPSCNLTARH